MDSQNHKNPVTSHENALPEAVEETDDGKQQTITIQVRKGWITKRGRIFHTWRRRWFEFNGAYLSYYKAAGKRPQGWLLLDPTTRILKSSKRPYCFVVKTLKRKMFLSCDNEDEMRSWIKVLRISLARSKRQNQVMANKSSPEDTNSTQPVTNPSSTPSTGSPEPSQESKAGDALATLAIDPEDSADISPTSQPPPGRKTRIMSREDHVIFRRSLISPDIHVPLPPLIPIDETHSSEEELAHSA